MAKFKCLDLFGLSLFKKNIVDLFTTHTSNAEIHVSTADRDTLTGIVDVVNNANEAAENANTAASYATSVGEDLITRLNNGEFNGKDGVVHTSAGQFFFSIEDDDLLLNYPEGEQPQDFEINENGELIYTYDY